MGRKVMQLLLGWILLLAGQPPVLAQSDPLYEAALNDFRASRIREAARNLKALLQKDPKSKEAAMLLATMYYQNRNLRKAYYWFEKGDVSLLNQDNAFAWGSTYLEFNEDRKAAIGFRYIVKTKGPFRPYALYYLGVVTYKSAQWLRAQKFFQFVNPADLTETMRLNRQRYLADIKRQQEKMLESIIGGTDNTGQNLTSTPPAVEAPAPAKEGTGPEEELGAIKPVSMGDEQKGWRHAFRPSLALTQQNQLFDNQGLNQENVNLFAHREGVSGLLNYGDERRGGSGISGGLEYNVGDIGYSARLEQVQYFTLDEASGVFTSQAARTEDENSVFLILQPHLSWSVNERTRFQLNLGLRSYIPDYDAGQAWGQGSQQFGARYEDGETELGLELALLEPFDAKQKNEAVDLAGRGELERQFGEMRLNLQAYGWRTDDPRFVSSSRFRLILADPQLRYRTGFVSEVGASGTLSLNIFSDTSLQLRLESLRREGPAGVLLNRLRSIDGVESAAYGALKSLVNLNVPLGDSATLTGSAAYHRLSDYHFTDVDDQGAILQYYVTDVDQAIYQAGGVISFAEWIRLSGTYTITGNRFLAASASDRAFRRLNPNYIVDSSLYLELAKSF